MFEILMFLFENYMHNQVDFMNDARGITTELEEAGFSKFAIHSAFLWLQGFALEESEWAKPVSEGALRIYTEEECKKLHSDSRGLLLFLEQAGVLDPIRREIAIDRALALEMNEIGLDQMKWIVLVVLFHHADQQAALEWMQELVLHADVMH